MSRSEKRTEGASSAPPRTVGNVGNVGNVADVGIELWRTATRWRRHAERELASVDLTLAQWLVLDATDALITELGDAINQNQVAARLEQDKMTVSQVMRALARKGLIDRGPDLLSTAYRIWVTASGIRALARGREGIEAASHSALGAHCSGLEAALLERQPSDRHQGRGDGHQGRGDGHQGRDD